MIYTLFMISSSVPVVCVRNIKLLSLLLLFLSRQYSNTDNSDHTIGVTRTLKLVFSKEANAWAVLGNISGLLFHRFHFNCIYCSLLDKVRVQVIALFADNNSVWGHFLPSSTCRVSSFVHFLLEIRQDFGNDSDRPFSEEYCVASWVSVRFDSLPWFVVVIARRGSLVLFSSTPTNHLFNLVVAAAFASIALHCIYIFNLFIVDHRDGLPDRLEVGAQVPDDLSLDELDGQIHPWADLHRVR